MIFLRVCSMVFLSLFVWPVLCSKHENCDKRAGGLADSMGKFLHCSLKFAVPVHVCLSCRLQFENMESIYSSFLDYCKAEKTNMDRLNVVQEGYSSVASIWKKGFCSECFSDGHVLESIETILNEARDFDNCKDANNKTFCENCFKHYIILNENYNNLVQKHKGGLCFDVQDRMNRTRSEWLICAPRKANLTIFSIMVPIALLLPLLFYGSSISVYLRSRNHSVLIEEGNEQNSEVSAIDSWATTSSGLNFTWNKFTSLTKQIASREQPGPSSAIESNSVDPKDINLEQRDEESSKDDDSLLPL